MMQVIKNGIPKTPALPYAEIEYDGKISFEILLGTEDDVEFVFFFLYKWI